MNKLKEEQKLPAFTSMLIHNVLQKLQQRSSFFFWIKKWRFFLIFWQNTQKKLLAFFSGPLLWLDFPFKNQSFTKHRKMQHWTQHKKRQKSLDLFFFSLHCLAALGFPKTGNDGNGKAVLRILDGDVKRCPPPSLRPQLEWDRWSWVKGGAGPELDGQLRFQAEENQMHAKWRLSPQLFSGKRQRRLLALSGDRARGVGTLSRWISGRPSSSGRQCTTCRGSPYRTPCGTSFPRHAPSDWEEMRYGEK